MHAIKRMSITHKEEFRLVGQIPGARVWMLEFGSQSDDTKGYRYFGFPMWQDIPNKQPTPSADDKAEILEAVVVRINTYRVLKVVGHAVSDPIVSQIPALPPTPNRNTVPVFSRKKGSNTR